MRGFLVVKIMAIENLEIPRTSNLPEGYSVEYSDDFEGELVIKENGELAGVSFGHDEKGAFKAVFRNQGIEIFNAWKLEQLKAEGGE